MKKIPTSGSRKQFTKNLSVFITIGYLITVVCVANNWISGEQVEAVGITFDRWWVAVGLVLTIFTTGEIGAKGAHAHMNKG